MTTVPRTILDLAATVAADVVEQRAAARREYRRLHDRLSLPDLLDALPAAGAAPRGPGVPRPARGSARARPQPARGALPAVPATPRPAAARASTPGSTWEGRRYQVDCLWPAPSVDRRARRLARRTAPAPPSARTAPATAACGSPATGSTRIAWTQLDDEPEAIAADLRSLLAAYRRLADRNTSVRDNVRDAMSTADRSDRRARRERRPSVPRRRRPPHPRPARRDGPLAARPGRALRGQRADALAGRARRDQPDPGRRRRRSPPASS